MNQNQIVQYYSKDIVLEAMVGHAKNKEVAVKYLNGSFGKRPDVLLYPGDIIEHAKKGAVSFHASEELWDNPLFLKPDMRKRDLDKHRIGFDLIIDIDCPVFEYSKIAAELLVNAIKQHGVNSVSIKFSGNKGFHIGVPFESFPSYVGSDEFPDAVRNVAEYLIDCVKEEFGKRVLEYEGSIVNVARKSGLDIKQLLDKEKKAFIPEPLLKVDTLLISSRHLYRMPFSLHEKSWLVSLPLQLKHLSDFNREDANPENIPSFEKTVFLKRNAEKGEASKLFDFALSFVIEKRMKQVEKDSQSDESLKLIRFRKSVREEFFPPCIKLGLKGLEDGRKRFVFCLLNFLRCVEWDYDAIQRLQHDWNEKNPEKLRERIIDYQLRYHKLKQKKIPPPNCSNQMYYKDIGICKPDSLCKGIKNPLQYVKKKLDKVCSNFQNKKKLSNLYK